MTVINENTIKADDGMVLTDGNAFGTTVYLGKYDSVDNWHEITEAEAERLQNAEIETPTEDEATEADLKAQAYDILMGVTE
jgi:hypothetical protein